MKKFSMSAPVLAICIAATACASLGQFIQPPKFSQADNQNASLRLLGPGAGHPLGGLGVRLYARVENPNPFGLTLTRLAGNLFIDNQRTANVDLPLGLPMRAAQDTVLPIDISVSFADIPNIVNTLKAALNRNSVGYRLDGTFGVDAGPLGQPSFGPQTLLNGDVRVLR